MMPKRPLCQQQFNLSYIDADSEDEVSEPAAVLPNKNEVKLRESRSRRLPRPSGILNHETEETESSESDDLSQRRTVKSFISFNKKKRRSPPKFYLQRSQSTKEVISENYSSNSSCNQPILEEQQEEHFLKANLRHSVLKRALTWGSLVAQLNRSFSFKTEQAAAASKQPQNVSKSNFFWRRSQSCRNIERLFTTATANRRYNFLLWAALVLWPKHTYIF